MNRTVAIIGAGPAGCAAAITLARAGRQVTLLERSPVTTEKVCGEFMAADAAAVLQGLGLDLAALGALPLSRVIMGAGRRQAAFALPLEAWSLPRLVLDAALLRAASDAGATIRLGTTVRRAEPSPQGWRLHLAADETLDASSLVLATGKHDLRGHAREAPSGSVGLKVVIAGASLPGVTALLAFRGGYAGLQPRSGGEANLCMAVDPARRPLLAEARDAGALVSLVAEGSDLARHLLRGATPLTARPLAVAGIPYGYRHRAGAAAGLYRVGDQAAVIPSLTGDGVALALASGVAAGRAILAGEEAQTFQSAWTAALAWPMRLACGLDRGLGVMPGVLVGVTSAFPGLARWLSGQVRVPPSPAKARIMHPGA